MRKSIIKCVLLLVSGSVFSQTTPVYVPTTSLSAWYPFTGNVNDLSANISNATNYGATLTSDNNNNSNSAYQFTSGSYIKTPVTPQPLSSHALFCNFYATTIGSNMGSGNSLGLGHCLVASDSCGSGGFAIGIVNGKFTSVAGVDWRYKNYNFVPNTWYKIGANFDAVAQTIEYFVNGISIGTNTVNPFSSSIVACRYHVGYNPTPLTWNVPFEGKIDEVGIWHRTLTLCEITNLYNAAIVCTGTGLNNADVSENSLEIFPNPTNGLFTIKAIERSRVEVMNCTGSLVLSDKFLPGEHTINLSDYPSGIYFVSLQKNNTRQVAKIVVQH
ncbi:MAG TPA: T9SS type A sorting domain-containing protein [Bacteroidia bacterium]|nr:T9SS type A sorting domain-containing protein [Bacteroidia bacterium]